MYLSLNWLSHDADLSGLDPEDIASRLTLTTAEIEGVEEVVNAADQAVVGEVLSVSPISATPREMSEVEVSCGDRRYLTVTAAPGMREGLRVAFAPPGAKLPGTVVGEATGAGQRSEGMICSPAELGLGGVDNTALVCPRDAAPGMPLSKWIPIRDVLLEVDNKTVTHRADLWGHYGFARELAAIYGRELRSLAEADASAWESLPEVPVALESPDCGCFSCLALDVADNVVSPLEIQGRLLVLGQQTFNVLIDVTNYVALELGQPTHMYDRDRVDSFRVAPIGTRRNFVTLDGQERELEPEDLMIWNRTEPVGLAGVMGGRSSAVLPSTRRVMLESANFRAGRVRRTSVRLGLRTAASQRFEKSQPPANTIVAARRIVELLDRAGARPRAVSRLTVAGDPRESPRPLEIPADYVSRLAGVEIPPERVSSILRALGFGAEVSGDALAVSVPPFRSEQDISLPADILEEVLRVYGYGEIPSQAPTAVLESTPFALDVRREHKARRLLATAHAATEVQTYPWYDDTWLSRIDYEPGPTLRLHNPTAPEHARLRTTLLPNLLKVAHDTVPIRDAFRLFEIGRVFSPDGEDGCRESARLACVSIRTDRDGDIEHHYRDVKGALEDLALMIADASLVASETDGGNGRAPWRGPRLWTALASDETVVGEFGALHGDVLRTVAPQRQAIWFELELEKLTGALYPNVSYEPLPVYPGSQQDFSLLWPTTNGYRELEAQLGEFEQALVAARELILVYDGEGVPAGMRSYTFRFTLQREDRTLTADDIDSFRAALIDFLDTRGISLR